jgi:hypothetical protein
MEYKILRLFMKKKWWLTSKTTQIRTSKHENFTIFPLILRVIHAEKTRFQPAKTQKMKNFTGRWNSNFQVIYEEQVMDHIQNHTKHDFEKIKFHHF